MYNIKLDIILLESYAGIILKVKREMYILIIQIFAYRDGRDNVNMTFFFLQFPPSLSVVNARN
jgi:hypothetical protein